MSGCQHGHTYVRQFYKDREGFARGYLVCAVCRMTPEREDRDREARERLDNCPHRTPPGKP